MKLDLRHALVKVRRKPLVKKKNIGRTVGLGIAY